ncbi:MAG: serine hydrolase, partial [Acidobacteria bacterium]|nr:serine hydrolase [Acidobacteriota bacterium]
DPHRVDMTFSVTKSFVSTAVGLAYDRKLIRSLDDRVRDYVAPALALAPAEGRVRAGAAGGGRLLEPFESEHNRKITWDHMLRQTSDWEGTLWGKPEWADRPTGSPAEWATRQRNEPGAVYEYNDVRVNALALAALSVWRRPLPQVLREHVMEPIGASPTWRWYGYDTSWVEVDGALVQSVSGGGHWGGGMFINARDMARFGLLTLRRGRWGDKQILSEGWIKRATTPTGAQPTYGFMNFFLNTERKFLPSAPAAAYAHVGNGTNMIYVDPENDLVVVVRWIENAAADGFIRRVLASINAAGRAGVEGFREGREALPALRGRRAPARADGRRPPVIRRRVGERRDLRQRNGRARGVRLHRALLGAEAGGGVHASEMRSDLNSPVRDGLNSPVRDG